MQTLIFPKGAEAEAIGILGGRASARNHLLMCERMHREAKERLEALETLPKTPQNVQYCTWQRDSVDRIGKALARAKAQLAMLMQEES